MVGSKLGHRALVLPSWLLLLLQLLGIFKSEPPLVRTLRLTQFNFRPCVELKMKLN